MHAAYSVYYIIRLMFTKRVACCLSSVSEHVDTFLYQSGSYHHVMVAIPNNFLYSYRHILVIKTIPTVCKPKSNQNVWVFLFLFDHQFKKIPFTKSWGVLYRTTQIICMPMHDSTERHPVNITTLSLQKSSFVNSNVKNYS